MLKIELIEHITVNSEAELKAHVAAMSDRYPGVEHFCDGDDIWYKYLEYPAHVVSVPETGKFGVVRYINHIILSAGSRM